MSHMSNIKNTMRIITKKDIPITTYKDGKIRLPRN